MARGAARIEGRGSRGGARRKKFLVAAQIVLHGF
jgi:hypothetical protein